MPDMMLGMKSFQKISIILSFSFLKYLGSFFDWPVSSKIRQINVISTLNNFWS